MPVAMAGSWQRWPTPRKKEEEEHFSSSSSSSSPRNVHLVVHPCRPVPCRQLRPGAAHSHSLTHSIDRRM
eukprot:4827334-Prymnesium_polylepis.1